MGAIEISFAIYEASRTGVARGCDVVMRQGITLGRCNATSGSRGEGASGKKAKEVVSG